MANEKRLIALDDLMKFPIRIDHYDKVNGNEHFVFGVESVLEYAEHLPTVDAVEVVHGEWIEDYETFVDANGYESDPIQTGWVCSECGKDGGLPNWHYCPNCGAKMDGGNTEDAVQVVRCKDCKHCSLDLSGRENHLCMRKEIGFVVKRKLDDFCSYGERKNGDENGV